MNGSNGHTPVHPPVVPRRSSWSEGARPSLPPAANGNGHSNGSNGNRRGSTTSNEPNIEAQGADPPLTPCAMSVILQPPMNVRPGDVFNAPVIVSLESRSSGNRRHDLPENDARYWALASIIHAGSNLLEGHTLATIKRADTPAQHPNMGYLVFPGLKIMEPGSFKIYISLVLMPGPLSDNERQWEMRAGTKVDAVITNEVYVEENAVEVPRRLTDQAVMRALLRTGVIGYI